jgi:DNA-binding NarL/FixJ family response regulator
VNRTCRLLLIEDDAREARTIERACCPDPTKVAFEIASNGADAEEAIRERDYDLFICDLALPVNARHGDAAIEEGKRLFVLIRERAPGTPAYILSGQGDLHMMREFFKVGASADLYGMKTEETLVQFFPKEDLPACVEAVQAHIAKTEVVDGFRLEGDDLGLSLSDQRALKIYGRLQGAERGITRAFDSGLSGSKTLAFHLRGPGDTDAGKAVAKLGDLVRVAREADSYEQIAPRLPWGLAAHLLTVVRAGAGSRGALIYEYAHEYTSTLAGLIAAGKDASAAQVAQRLREGLRPWFDGAPEQLVGLDQLRRDFVSDADLHEAGVEVLSERDIEVRVAKTMAHGDLHGFNVLVKDGTDPTLIDYGEVGDANAALDPVTLELSSLFHPHMAGAFGDWPQPAQAAGWDDLDTYLDGCPVPEFVRACRDWAREASAEEEELLATAYSYAMRQMKYPDTNKELALAIANGAQGKLLGI